MQFHPTSKHDFNRAIKAAALLVTALLAAACSSDKIAPAALQDFKPSTTLAKVWSITLDDIQAAPSVLRAQAGMRLVTPAGKDIVAIQAQNGAVVWRTPLGTVQAPVGVSADNQSVLALVQGVEAVSLNANTGAVLWRSALPAEMRTQPASVGGVFVVLTADGRIVGLEEATGRRKWALARTLPVLTVRGSGAVAALSNTIAAVGLQGGKAVGVNVNSGQIVWEANLAQIRGVNEVERISDVLPQWVSVPGLGLCATSYRQRAACVDEKGQITHTQDMSALSGLVISGQQWFAVEDDSSVKAWTFKKSSAATLTSAASAPNLPDWSFAGLKGRMGNSYQALAAFGGVVFAHDNLGALHVLSAQNGQTIARLNTGLSADAALTPVLVDGKALLIVSAGKAMIALQAAQ